jgi:hypothetical protein
MEQSILTSTEKILMVPEEYTAFDMDIITHINSTFAVLSQLGVGPADGFMIEDATAVWTDFMSAGPSLNLVKTYVYLKVRLLFDPPATSFLIQSVNEQIAQYEWRLNALREVELP